MRSREEKVERSVNSLLPLIDFRLNRCYYSCERGDGNNWSIKECSRQKTVSLSLCLCVCLCVCVFSIKTSASFDAVVSAVGRASSLALGNPIIVSLNSSPEILRARERNYYAVSNTRRIIGS